MSLLARLWNRAFPALLLSISVVLLGAGLLAYAPAGPSGDPTLDPGDPGLEPTAPAIGGVPSPTDWLTPLPPGAAGPSPGEVVNGTAEPSPGPDASPSPGTSFGYASPGPGNGATPSPGNQATPDPGNGATPPPANGGTPRPAPTRPPTAGPSPGPITLGNGRATRIVIPAMNIDLAVVSQTLNVPGNRNHYPLCDVAQYLNDFARPGAKGTTYIYAHARRGMFLPLLEASRRNNGREMIGYLVEVYTSDNRLHLYEIFKVKRHATDLSLAYQLPREGRQLVMQTSEGPRGHAPKLQVAARPIGVVPADPREAKPAARPRACR
ncbi:MAG TPA: sortase [Candidatus Limnocylindrales bacterium]|nr:sortase [Candidatus Limnocylindrales bacterium]